MRGYLRSLRRAAHVREVRRPPLNDTFLQPSCIGTSAFPDFTHPSSIGLTATFLELWHPGRHPRPCWFVGPIADHERCRRRSC